MINHFLLLGRILQPLPTRCNRFRPSLLAWIAIYIYYYIRINVNVNRLFKIKRKFFVFYFVCVACLVYWSIMQCYCSAFFFMHVFLAFSSCLVPRWGIRGSPAAPGEPRNFPQKIKSPYLLLLLDFVCVTVYNSKCKPQGRKKTWKT